MFSKFLNLPRIGNYLNLGEFLKTMAASHLKAIAVGAVIAVLTAVAANAGAIFPNAVVAYIISQVVLQVVGVLRKLPTDDANPTPAK